MGKIGFAEWAERWFAATADLKPATRRTYRMLLDNQVLPHFGTATLAGIDTLAVREWIAALVKGGPSPSRVRNADQVLSQVLAAAVEGGRLARNPATGIRLPKRVEREMLFLDAAQVEQLADAIGPNYRVCVYFLAYTGLRFGEAVALRVKRLDLLRGRCEVVESATEVGSALVWDSTKTDERRVVRLPGFLVELLAEHLVMTLDRYGHLWPDELEDLAERLDRARAAAIAPSARPVGGPVVAQLRKRPGQ